MTAHHGAGIAQRRCRRVLRPVASRLWNFELTGFERLPQSGPAILCPNHISFFDSVALALSVERNVSFVGKAEYMDSWTTKYTLPALGMIPIDRSGGDKSAAALDVAAGVLDRGELFAIFPEGSRSRSGDLHKGRTGAARLAMRTGAPIYPVGITGTDAIQPPGARRMRVNTSCAVQIGAPIAADRFFDAADEAAACRAMTDEVMSEIRSLTGQRYVHRYAGEQREVCRPELAIVPTAANRPLPAHGAAVSWPDHVEHHGFPPRRLTARTA